MSSVSVSLDRINSLSELITVSDYCWISVIHFFISGGYRPVLSLIPTMRGTRFTASDGISLTIVCQEPTEPSRLTADKTILTADSLCFAPFGLVSTGGHIKISNYASLEPLGSWSSCDIIFQAGVHC
jgi:hypothetical protein